MGEPSFLEVATSIRDVIRQNLSPAHQYIPHSNTSAFDRLASQPPILQPPLDYAHHASAWKLPEHVFSEVMSIMPKELKKHQDVTEQAYLRLLHDIHSRCDGPMATALIPHARIARDAIYNRSVNGVLGAVQQLANTVDVDGGSVSGVDEDDSETSSSEEEEDEDDLEGAELDEAEEDENTPMKPGEEVPPLETKYLPIFEALHERGKVLTKPEKTYLVNLTGMTYRQITIWFQNRRRGELKEDMNARISNYAASTHTDDTSDLSDDEVILEKQLSHAQPSDTTFNIRSWRLASAVASGGVPPAFPPSPTKVGFSDPTIPQLHPDDTDSELSDSDEELARSDGGLRVPSLTTSSATFDSSSDHGPATVTSTSSSQVLSGSCAEPTTIAQKGGLSDSNSIFTRPIKHLPSSRRSSPTVSLQSSQQRVEPPQAPAFNFNFTGPASNPPKQFVSVPLPTPAQPPQFVTSNERGLTVEMDTTPPRSTITLQSPFTSVSNANTSGALPSASPSSPAVPTGSPHSAPSPALSGDSATSPRPAVKPLPRRTGCAPRPRPPPRLGSIATIPATTPAAPSSARSSVVLAPVVLPPSSNPSLASTTLGALLRPNIPPPNIPPEMEERLSAMAGRLGVGAAVNGQKRTSSVDGSGLARTTVALPQHGSFNFSPPLPGPSISGRPTSNHIQLPE